jgi:hypothetical protein
VLWYPPYPKILFTMVKLGKWVTHAVKLWELHLVRGLECLIVFIIISWASVAVGRWLTSTLCVTITLQLQESHAQHLLLLTLFHHRGF